MAAVGSRAAAHHDRRRPHRRTDLGYDRVAFHAAAGRRRSPAARGGGGRAARAPARGRGLRSDMRCAVRPLCRRTEREGFSELAVPVRAGEPGPGRARSGALRRLRSSRTRSSTSSPRSPVSWRWPSRSRSARRRPSGWRGRWPSSTTSAWRPTALRDLRPALRQGGGGGGPPDPRRPHLGPALRSRGRMRCGLRGLGPRPAPASATPSPVFRLGEGVAGRVARDRVPAMVNEPRRAPGLRAPRPTRWPALHVRAPHLLRPEGRARRCSAC